MGEEAQSIETLLCESECRIHNMVLSCRKRSSLSYYKLLASLPLCQNYPPKLLLKQFFSNINLIWCIHDATDWRDGIAFPTLLSEVVTFLSQKKNAFAWYFPTIFSGKLRFICKFWTLKNLITIHGGQEINNNTK